MITEYVYLHKCFVALKVRKHNYLIIAGNFGGSCVIVRQIEICKCAPDVMC